MLLQASQFSVGMDGQTIQKLHFNVREVRGLISKQGTLNKMDRRGREN